MAAKSHPLSFQCEFVDSVPEDFYCKICNLVARKATITSCCGETYCHACIADTQEQGKPCPACGEKDFTLTKQMKYQKRIEKLLVYCRMKERGCGWSGPLEQLDAHLDPDQDNCQYVDTKCPLHCHMAVPKNKVEEHVAEHCAKRPYVCQYCNFKATYEEVVDKHLPECKYVPLQCPNLCGVTFERDFMEDHMKMCRLEEVRCEFGGVGCANQFRREDQEEHARQNSQKHLTLTATVAMETREQLQDQIIKYREREQNLQQKLRDQEQKLLDQEQILKVQEPRLKEYEQKLEEQELKLKEQELKLKEQEQQLNELKQELKEELERKSEEQKDKLVELNGKFEQYGKQRDSMTNQIHVLEQKVQKLIKSSEEIEIQLHDVRIMKEFKIENFSRMKEEGSTWCSPAMYTHVKGYEYRIVIYANGLGPGNGKAIALYVHHASGKFDDQLKWPVKVMFTIELVNQVEGDNHNVVARNCCSWSKPDDGTFVYRFKIQGSPHFIEHSHLKNIIINDTLQFFIKTELC